MRRTFSTSASTGAVSGAAIPLDMLNYWSVELQEAYASGALMTQRWVETHKA